MEIKDYVKQFRDLQKSHKKVRVADFCRENMLDYYEMVEALKQDKFESESFDNQVQCGDLVITEIPESGESTQPMPATESYRVDNNAAESIMRDLACGRKNFLFCGSDNAAKNLAFAYSLTESCKLNNINPYDYWSDLIDFVGCELLEQRRHTKASFLFAES